ncbi:MAG: hypothetical protein HYV26_23225 [Candidatus Hydrogenedentes bacterium]|nr:hypothetical protein [Candidatus Hydrogenedentota bacterium]
MAEPANIEIAETNAGVDSLMLRLDRMSTLTSGWDSYGAEPPSQQAITNARAFVALLESENILPVTVLPSSAGGVGITFEEQNLQAFVEFRNDGSKALMFSDFDSEETELVSIPERETNPQSIVRRIQEFLNAAQ